ncbi:Abscisic acid G-protein coupled receptor-domain-containing protein [Chlamydoabsidia padenii]|nr:Abscisic acid G-protein coupled receptor-domain-containing protein [Chlamydoabsidia padenii]
MALTDAFCFLTTQIILVTIGSHLVSQLLLKDYKPPGLMHFTKPLYCPHLIFSLTLGAAGSLFLLVFGEIINVFSKGTRWQYWQFNLSLLLFLVIIVIPWYQVYTFLYETKRWRRKTAMYATTLVWAFYLYFFNKTTLLSQYTNGQHNTTTSYSWLELGILRVSVLGITLTSILSGFGVVNSPFMTWTVYTQHVSESEYTVAQQAFDNTLLTIQEKKAALDRLHQLEHQRVSPNQKPSGFLNQLLSSVVGNTSQNESKLLEIEIRQLEHLSLNMKSDLEELGRGRVRSQLSRTWKGKVQNGIDLVFSIYCVYRLLTTTFNVLMQRTGSGDPITNTLSLMIGHFGTNLPLDPKFWSQQLSFWFAGIIVFGSVRGALKLLTKILRNFTQQLTISTSNIILFIAHMLGMYFLSSVLMMQVSLPPDYRYLISSTLEHTEFTFFQRWSDIILVLSSLITGVILYVINQTNDAKSLATDYADIQLSAIESGNIDRRRLD